MKRRMKVDVVTRRKGLFGLREVVRRRTITLPGQERPRPEREQWNRPFSSEAERLAALYRTWEEEMAEDRRKEWQ